jgi:D,D-heptose 1,7-bisphosphate phosphatase
MFVKQCVILVGGLGTRLGPLTRDVPKPLLPIGGRVFIDFLLDQILRHGFTEVICLAGYLSDAVRHWALNARRPGFDVKVVVEPEPWGTAGALLASRDLLDEEFLLFNGDSIFDINLLDLTVCRPSGEWAGLIALRSMKDTGRYGVVEADGDRILSFAERPPAGGPGLINGGVYRLKRQALNMIGSPPSSIEREVFPAMAHQRLLRGRTYDRFFLDIGVPQAFESAQALLPELVRRPALFLDRDGVVNLEVGYAHRPDQIKWVPGIFQAVKVANDAGFYVFVVTNQAGVARGLYSERAVIDLHQWMNTRFREYGAHIDEFAYCPHHPTAGSTKYTRVCECRKPAPGMLTDLAQRWSIDLTRSLFVGDRDTDLQAAHGVGIPSVLHRANSVMVTIDAWLKEAAH